MTAFVSLSGCNQVPQCAPNPGWDTLPGDHGASYTRQVSMMNLPAHQLAGGAGRAC